MLLSIISTFIIFMYKLTWRSLAFRCKLHHNHEERKQDTHRDRSAHSDQSVEWPAYVPNDWDIGFQFHSIQVESGSLPGSCPLILGHLFFTLNGNLHLQSAKVKNVWGCISTPSNVFPALCLINDRDKIPCLHYMERQVISWFILPNIIGMVHIRGWDRT